MKKRGVFYKMNFLQKAAVISIVCLLLAAPALVRFSQLSVKNSSKIPAICMPYLDQNTINGVASWSIYSQFQNAGWVVFGCYENSDVALVLYFKADKTLSQKATISRITDDNLEVNVFDGKGSFLWRYVYQYEPADERSVKRSEKFCGEGWRIAGRILHSVTEYDQGGPRSVLTVRPEMRLAYYDNQGVVVHSETCSRDDITNQKFQLWCLFGSEQTKDI